MKILIMGTGAIGGFFGTKLALNKNNKVTFLVRKEKISEMKKKGLTVKAVEGNFFIKDIDVTNKTKEIYDLILFTVKNYDVDEAIKIIKNGVGTNTLILPLQNGIEAYQKLSQTFGKEKVLIGVAYIFSSKKHDTLIEQIGGACQIIYGEQNGKINNRIKNLQKIFEDSKINAKYSSSPITELWSKFIFICAIAGITALTRSPLGPIRQNSVTKQMYIDLLKEDINCAQKLKITLPEDYLKIMTNTMETLPKSSKSSLLIDLENNHKTEIDYLNGALVKLAKQNGVKVPLNELIYNCIKIQTQ
jgi:2-dehydropantoate 2-reductase